MYIHVTREHSSVLANLNRRLLWRGRHGLDAHKSQTPRGHDTILDTCPEILSIQATAYCVCVGLWTSIQGNSPIMGNMWTTTTNNFLVHFKDRRLSDHSQHWIIDVESMPKLRTYKCLKTSYGTEHYLKANMSIPQRSYLAKTRMGTLPLKIETEDFGHQWYDCQIMTSRQPYFAMWSKNKL